MFYLDILNHLKYYEKIYMYRYTRKDDFISYEKYKEFVLESAKKVKR